MVSSHVSCACMSIESDQLCVFFFLFCLAPGHLSYGLTDAAIRDYPAKCLCFSAAHRTVSLGRA